jgi:hypothetical protein
MYGRNVTVKAKRLPLYILSTDTISILQQFLNLYPIPNQRNCITERRHSTPTLIDS